MSDLEHTVNAASRICANTFCNYLIGGNVTNAFALGEVGSADDFFIVGAPPEEGVGYPLITANLLGAGGSPACRVVRNVLLENPAKCRRVVTEAGGYEILDAAGNPLLKVQSTWLATAGQFVITLAGDFQNRKGDPSVSISAQGLSFGKAPVPMAIGFLPNAFGMGLNLRPDLLEAAKWCLTTGGAVHRVVRGDIADRDFNLDGNLFFDATLRNCRLTGSTLNFAFAGKINLAQSKIHLDGVAAQVFRLAQILMSQTPGISTEITGQ